MNSRKVKLIVLLGFIGVIGIIAIQVHWLKEAYDYEEKKFGEKVHIALLEVVKRIYGSEMQELPVYSPIQQVSKDYYVVNTNNYFDAEILEFYLKDEFQKFNVKSNFEYAVYDCVTDNMIYGNYIQQDSIVKPARASYFPKFDNLVYYFAVRFPNRTDYFITTLKPWLVASTITFAVLIIYVYSIFIILQQKRYSELQKDFINNMTHEFKTPLSSILIASNYLLRQPSISGDDRLKRYTRTILSQGNRLNVHVEKILNLAKSESTALKLEKSKVEVTSFLKGIIEEFLIKYPEAKITLESDSKYYILADKVHFANLAHNILDNAVKYSEKEPKIRIAITSQGNGIEISFQDNGIGIMPEHQKFIFRKFYRGAGLDNRPIHGFGLGLFYVKRICEQHGWKLELKSTSGEGSVFSIMIPKISP